MSFISITTEKNIFVSEASHTASSWERGFGQLAK